ncbi:MAG TPA: CRISPR-associated protein Csx3 [candidate division Zixibacteria bacterium]|nr:CRISPR-associated protein Csx3 [candidate division Zixibacteria bacterium]
MAAEHVTINVEELYVGLAKLDQLEDYIRRVLDQAGEGNEVTITGKGPIWLYLRLAHALHGKALRLIYQAPNAENVLIFDHNPY